MFKKQLLATSSSVALTLACLALPTHALADDVVYDSGTTAIPFFVMADKFLIVGDVNPNQTATTSGGFLSFRVGIVGSTATSNNNILRLTNGTAAANYFSDTAVTGPALLIGNYGGGNLLEVLSGSSLSVTHVDGLASPDDVMLGYHAGANNNTLRLSGGSLSIPASTLYVGYNSNGNAFEVLNGGYATMMQMRVGGGTASTTPGINNSVLVSSSGRLITDGTLNLGASANSTGNTLTVSAGGSVEIGWVREKALNIGLSTGANNNIVTVTGRRVLASFFGLTSYYNSNLSAYSIVVGTSGNTGNTLRVLDYGTVDTLALTFSAHSVLGYQLMNTGDARIQVDGPLNIISGATFQPILAGGSAIARTTPVISATSINGTFSTLDTSAISAFTANFTPSLNYTPTSVNLNLLATIGAGLNLTPSQKAAANAINAAFNSGSALPNGFMNLFGVSGTALANNLTKLSGQASVAANANSASAAKSFISAISTLGAPNGQNSSAGSTRYFSYAPAQPTLPSDVAASYDRLLKNEAPAVSPWTLSGSFSGGLARVNTDTENPGIASRSAGVLAAATYATAPDASLGFAIGGNASRWTVGPGYGSGKAEAFQAGLYGNKTFGAAYVSGVLAFANQWADLKRDVEGSSLTAETVGQTYSARIESGYRITQAAGDFIPYAAVETTYGRTPGYAETDTNNGMFALAFGRSSYTSPTSELGLRYEVASDFGNGHSLKWLMKAGWVHDYSDAPTMRASIIAMPGADFTVTGNVAARNLASLSAGAEFNVSQNATLTAKVDSELSGSTTSLGGFAQFRVKF